MIRTRALQALLASALWLCGSMAQAANPTLPPPDPAQLSPQVRRAVDELRNIVARHDLAALERHVSADANMSFGGAAPGAAGLREVWEPQRPDTPLWHELAEILRLGGVETSVNGEIAWSAPYPSFAGENIYQDPYGAFIVTGTQVALRKSPDIGAPVVARVDYAVLESDCSGTEDWICVRWNDAPAFVRSSLVRSPVDQRLSMRVTADHWSITFFVAGD